MKTEKEISGSQANDYTDLFRDIVFADRFESLQKGRNLLESLPEVKAYRKIMEDLSVVRNTYHPTPPEYKRIVTSDKTEYYVGQSLGKTNIYSPEDIIIRITQDDARSCLLHFKHGGVKSVMGVTTKET